MDKKMKDQAQLEPLFAALRAEAPDPTPDLLDRVLADADHEMMRRDARAQAKPGAQIGVIDRILAPLGGWVGLGGLATCTLLGVGAGLGSADLIDQLMPGLDLAGVSDDSLFTTDLDTDLALFLTEDDA